MANLEEKRQGWLKLDNAAKIYPASRSRNWTALFRLSATLKQPVDPILLQQALETTIHRFPSYGMRLRRGLFWYYLDPIDKPPTVQKDVRNPCVRMDFKEQDGYLFRVRYFDRRIAVEFFHALTDGNGGLLFLKTLTAEYLTLKEGISIPRGDGVLDCEQSPDPAELEDSYLRFARDASISRKEQIAYHIPGTDTRHYLHITTGILPVDQVSALSKQYGCTIGELFTSLLILAIEQEQLDRHPNSRFHRPVKICVPVNLRKYYPVKTVRNFASYVNPGIDFRLGDYSLAEVARLVHAQMTLETDEKKMNARFATNVMSERNLALRMAPLFLKIRAMRLVFRAKGDRLTSSTISNLGNVKLPAEMQPYVERLDFLLGPLSHNRVACAVTGYNGKLYFNITRCIEEAHVERYFFTSLVKLGIPVQIESNLPQLQSVQKDEAEYHSSCLKETDSPSKGALN